MEVIQMWESKPIFNVKSRNGVKLINISGHLDALTVPELKFEFRKIMSDRNYKVVANLENVNIISTMAIGTMLIAAIELRLHKGDLKLCGLSKDESMAFRQLGVLEILETYKTEKEALDSFYQDSN
jgi:anti-anti-sigma factor